MRTDPHEISIREQRIVPHPVDVVWAVLGDFGSEHRWSSQLARCGRDADIVAVGTVRTCRLARPLLGRRQVTERVTDYQPGRTLAYQLGGGAGPFRTAGGRWSLCPDGRGCTVIEVTGSFQPRSQLAGRLAGPLARRIAARAARRALTDLTTHLTHLNKAQGHEGTPNA